MSDQCYIEGVIHQLIEDHIDESIARFDEFTSKQSSVNKFRAEGCYDAAIKLKQFIRGDTIDYRELALQISHDHSSYSQVASIMSETFNDGEEPIYRLNGKLKTMNELNHLKNYYEGRLEIFNNVKYEIEAKRVS